LKVLRQDDEDSPFAEFKVLEGDVFYVSDKVLMARVERELFKYFDKNEA
jgi:hypothetical protein